LSSLVSRPCPQSPLSCSPVLHPSRFPGPLEGALKASSAADLGQAGRMCMGVVTRAEICPVLSGALGVQGRCHLAWMRPGPALSSPGAPPQATSAWSPISVKGPACPSFFRDSATAHLCSGDWLPCTWSQVPGSQRPRCQWIKEDTTTERRRPWE
jgi:hypothetical protein